MNDKLTDKQAKFVSEYPVDLNATQAAIRAGYSQKTAGSQGQRLLTNVDIAEAIQKAKEKAALRNEITVDSVTQMHKEAFDMAKKEAQASAMTASAQNLAKLHGLIIDKAETKHSLSAMSSDEIDSRINQLLDESE